MSLIELEKVFKSYYLGKGAVEVAALGGIDLEIAAGEYLAIMGPSGSGKSTLLNLLGCLDRVTSGRYILDGLDVSTLDDNELSDIRCRRLGFIFQSYNLIPQLTVLENIAVPLYYQGQEEASRRARAGELAALMGLGDRLGHKSAQLSGGQQQRVAIARALANDPLIILADEPTGNLDSKTGGEILDTLDDLNRQGRTLLIVTHDTNVAARAQRVIHMLDGHIESDRKIDRP